MTVSNAIIRLAKENGVPEEQVRYEMRKAIQAAKNNPNFQALFGNEEPSLEAFITTLAGMIQLAD